MVKNMLEINVGERMIQKGFRIGIKEICARYGIKEGDVVEVFILVSGK
jgi:hypothetical protein